MKPIADSAKRSVRILIIVLSACFIACVIILAYLIGGSNEILCPIQPDVHCICDVIVDCCCPTESVTPTETSLPFSTPTESPVPLRTNTSVPASRTPTKRAKKTKTIIPSATSTPVPTPTHTDAPSTETPFVPTATVPMVSATPSCTWEPTKVECYQWVCHKIGNGWKDYCCDSEGCISAHLAHGDYLGRCVSD